MSSATTARIAGATILVYIAASIAGTVLFDQMSNGEGTAARLANLAAHAPQIGLIYVLALLTIFAALILAVALYELTRDEDPELALFALTCRVVEGVLNAVPAIAMLALPSISLQAASVTGSEASASNAVGSFLLKLQGWTTIVSAPVFGAGSALYYYLLARARSIPIALAWFGVLSSLLLVIAIPEVAPLFRTRV